MQVTPQMKMIFRALPLIFLPFTAQVQREGGREGRREGGREGWLDA
jgi:hypothetical protein